MKIATTVIGPEGRQPRGQRAGEHGRIAAPVSAANR